MLRCWRAGLACREGICRASGMLGASAAGTEPFGSCRDRGNPPFRPTRSLNQRAKTFQRDLFASGVTACLNVQYGRLTFKLFCTIWPANAQVTLPPPHAHHFAPLTTHGMDAPTTPQTDPRSLRQLETCAYFGSVGDLSWAVCMHLLIPNSLSPLLRATKYPSCAKRKS